MKKLWIPGIILAVATVFLAGLYFGSNIEAGRIQDTLAQRDGGGRRIAVVNADTGVLVDGARLNYSAAIIETLGEDFVLVSPAMAQNGLIEGIYRAVLTFPSNVSERILSFNAENPERVALEIQVNPNLPESEYVETHVELLNLNMSINLTMGYTYLSSIFTQFHAAQDQMGAVFRNKQTTIDATEAVRLEDFSPALELELPPETDLESVEADTSEYFLAVTDFAEQIKMLYLTNFEAAADSYAAMRELVDSLTDDFPRQREDWLEETEAWSDEWTEYTADLHAYYGYFVEYKELLLKWREYEASEWHYELETWQEGLENWHVCLTGWFEEAECWLKKAERWHVKAEPWPEKAERWLGEAECWFKEAERWHVKAELWPEKAECWFEKAKCWFDKAVRWFEEAEYWLESLNGNSRGALGNIENEGTENLPDEPRGLGAHDYGTPGNIENTGSLPDGSVGLEAYSTQPFTEPPLLNEPPPLIEPPPPIKPPPPFELPPPFEPPPLIGLPPDHRANMPDVDKRDAPRTWNEPFVLPAMPYEHTPPQPDGLWEDINLMHGAMRQFNIEDYLTDALWEQAQSLLGAYYSYLDFVRDDLSFQFLENIFALYDVRLEYIEYLHELREVIFESEYEAMGHLQETLYAFLGIADGSSLDTQERLADFAGMMPLSRAAGGVNQDLVNFAIGPVEFVAPASRSDSDIIIAPMTGIFLLWLWVALAALGAASLLLFIVHAARVWQLHR